MPQRKKIDTAWNRSAYVEYMYREWYWSLFTTENHENKLGKSPLRYANTTHTNDSPSSAGHLVLPHYPPECLDCSLPSITQVPHRRQADNHPHCGKNGSKYRHTLLRKKGVCCAKKTNIVCWQRTVACSELLRKQIEAGIRQPEEASKAVSWQSSSYPSLTVLIFPRITYTPRWRLNAKTCFCDGSCTLKIINIVYNTLL